jgi:MYXO-CTERM domain-containing protein
MYREVPRTNGMTEASAYGLDTAQQAHKIETASPPLVRSEPAPGAEPEALWAAVSLGALLVITLAGLLQAWL